MTHDEILATLTSRLGAGAFTTSEFRDNRRLSPAEIEAESDEKKDQKDDSDDQNDAAENLEVAEWRHERLPPLRNG